MPDFTVGRYPYRKRHLVAETVQAALAPIIAHNNSDPAISGGVTVIVRVEAPRTADIAPEDARGCATKV